LTEIYGPPGVGKTAFAMQLASNALHSGNRVVWIDTGSPIPGPRFQEILGSYSIPPEKDPPSSPPIARSMDDLLENFTYFNVHTLPHLLVLFLHPTAKFPPDKTALIIVDNVSAPFATAFPRSLDAKMGSLDAARRNKLQWAANRKWAVAGDLASAMSKMAALKNVAVLAINQVATSLKGVRKAVLKPAISGTAWEAAVHNRVILWRDFAPPGSELGPLLSRSLRFAVVVKAGGRPRPTTAEDAVPFVIETVCILGGGSLGANSAQEGLCEIKLAVSPAKEVHIPILDTTTSAKRKASEIADSEVEGDELGSDDDFGVHDDDIFNDALLDDARNDLSESKEPG
jgi:Rad51